MPTTDKPVWKIAVEAFFAAVAAGAALSGLQRLLVEAGVTAESNLATALMSAVYLAVFLPLFYFLFRQRAQLERVGKERREQELRDETTRLYKGRVFRELAGSQIRMCKRNGWPVGMVMFDIDGLGRINEEHGYEAGNAVLKHFASVLEETVRESDLAARIDDDRFALLLPDCDAKNAKKVVQRVQERVLSRPLKGRRGEIKVPFSCGVVSFAGKVAKYKQLAERADEALKAAKRRGGNRIELF